MFFCRTLEPQLKEQMKTDSNTDKLIEMKTEQHNNQIRCINTKMLAKDLITDHQWEKINHHNYLQAQHREAQIIMQGVDLSDLIQILD